MMTPASTLTQIELKSAIVRNPIVVTGETTVMAAIALMSGVRAICAADDAEGYADNVHQEARSSCVLVMGEETVLGILTERDVVRLSAQQRSLDEVMVQEVMASPVIALRDTEFTDLFSAVNLLQQRRIRHLPILDRDQRLLGILTHESLRQLARPVDLLRLRLVSEVMTSKVMCAEPSTSMLVIAQLMAERRVGSILIVEHRLDPAGQPLQMPVGIITERDIVQFQSLRMNLTQVEVQAVMSTPVFSVRPEDSLMVVQEVMEQRSIRRLVVTGTQGELLGIVTQTSLLQALNPLELYTLSKILEEKVSQLEADKVRLLENYATELERQVAQRTAELNIKAEREQLMAKVAVKIAASRSLLEVLETTVQELRSLLRCDRMVIWQFQPDWSGVIVAESVGEGWRAALHDAINDPCFRGDLVESYTAGHTLATANIHTAGYPRCYIQLLEQYQVKSNLVVPIRVSGQLWGLLIGHQCGEYRDWQAADLTILDEMAVQIAIAIQQAMAYQQAQAELLERQRAEVALQQSEQRFRAIFDNTFQFTGLMTLDGTLIEANQAALAFGDVTQEQVLNRPFWEAYWWTISPQTQAQLQQATHRAAQGEFIRYEVDVLGAGGEIITIDFSLRPLLDDRGQVILLIPEGRDISDLKKTQKALEFQVEFDRLVANISNRLIQITPQEMTAGINQALQEIGEFSQVDASYVFQYSDSQPTHSMTHEWVAPGLAPNLPHAQNLPLALFPWGTLRLTQEQIVHISSLDDLPPEAAIDQQSFRRIGIQSVLSIPLITQGRVVGLVGFATLRQQHVWTDDNIRLLKIFADILTNTLQRQQAETELQASEQRYATLAQSAPVGIFRTDVAGNCLYVNDRWCQIAGLTVAEAAGFGWVNGIHPDDRERVAIEWNTSIVENRPFSLEYRFQNPEGQITWAYGQAVSTQDDTGETIGYVGTITDISDRKQAELALIQSEARSSAILDAIPDLMFRVGGDGIYRELGRLKPEIDVLIGLDPAGLMMADILPGELATRNLHYIDRAITTGELQVYEQEVWIGDRQQIEEVRVVRSGDNEALLMIRDISDRKLAEQSLQIQRDFNQLIAEITSRFVDLSPEDLDFEIDRTLQLIAEITQVDTSYLIKLDEVAGTMSMTHEWSQPGSLRQIAIAQDMPLAAFPWSISLLRQREIIYVPSVQELPVVAAMDKAGWQRYNLVAVLQVPLVQKSVVTGLMGFASFSQVMTWENETIRLLQVMGQTIANAQERTQDEQQLYESEERLRLALAAANQGLYDLNLQTGETVVSPDYATMLGYDPNTFEETNAKWLERLHPDDRSAVASTFKAYVTGTRPDYKVEFRQRTANGDWQWVLSIGKIVEWDAAGEPLRMLGTHTDISDRKQAELALQQLNQELETKVAQRTAALRASEATNRATLEAIPDLLLRLRRDGTCLEYIQPAHQSNTFLPITNHLAEVLPPDLLHNHLQVTERAIATGELQVYEHQFLKYGRMVYEEVRTVAINQDEVLAIVRDISDRKRADQQLKNQLAAIEAAIDGIGILQGEYYIYLNSAHLSLFGYDRPEEIVGQSWKQLYPDEELFRFEREVFPRLRQNGYWSGEATAIRKDGTTFAEELSLTLTDEGLLICVCRDISDRKQAEQELLESQQFIEKIAEASPNIIYLYDLQERRSVYSNRQISSALGYTPLEIQAMGADFFTNLMHPDDLANIPDHFAQIGVADDETIFELEYRMRHADGE